MIVRIGQRRRAHLYLTEWRDYRGLSDETLGNRIGVARETVFRWRTEPHRLNPDKLAVLASALDCEPCDFYRLPSDPSLDAIVSGVPADLRATVTDVVRRLVGKRS